MRDRSALGYCFLLVLVCGPGLAQENAKPLSPSEAYKAALAPFQASRTQPDDLTDADRFALQIGIARASRDCRALSSDTSSLDADEKELIALGDLCLFGQEYGPARAALTKYLALPQPPERKRAMVLLVRALLGLNDPGSAELVVRSLLHDFPYDAEIHFAIDQVIDASEGLSEGLNRMALNLCATQNAATLPLLTSGKALEGKEETASASVLFNDAVRCVSLAKGRDEASGQEVMHQLAAIAQMPSWQGTADYSTHAGVVAEAANGRDPSPRDFIARVYAHEWENGAAPDLAEARHSSLASLCSLVPERLRRGRTSGQNGIARDHLRNYQLECQHRPRRCPIQ